MACLPTVGRHGLVVAQPDERLVHAGRDVLQAQAHVVDQRTNHDDGEENGRRQPEGDRGETVRGELHRAARGGPDRPDHPALARLGRDGHLAAPTSRPS
jgi:hypothetical protein